MEPVRDLELYRGLEQALGANVATALMDRLPPEPARELVTKTDLSAELATLCQEVSGEFATLRQEMNAMKHELMAAVRGEMIGAIHTQGRQLAFILAGSLVGLSGLAFAIANLYA